MAAAGANALSRGSNCSPLPWGEVKVNGTRKKALSSFTPKV
jgi:hypothetical protein